MKWSGAKGKDALGRLDWKKDGSDYLRVVLAKIRQTGEGLDDQDLHREILNGPDETKGDPIDLKKESGRMEIPRLRGVARAEGLIKIRRLTTHAQLRRAGPSRKWGLVRPRGRLGSGLT